MEEEESSDCLSLAVVHYSPVTAEHVDQAGRQSGRRALEHQESLYQKTVDVAVVQGVEESIVAPVVHFVHAGEGLLGEEEGTSCSKNHAGSHQKKSCLRTAGSSQAAADDFHKGHSDRAVADARCTAGLAQSVADHHTAGFRQAVADAS